MITVTLNEVKFAKENILITTTIPGILQINIKKDEYKKRRINT